MIKLSKRTASRTRLYDTDSGGRRVVQPPWPTKNRTVYSFICDLFNGDNVCDDQSSVVYKCARSRSRWRRRRGPGGAGRRPTTRRVIYVVCDVVWGSDDRRCSARRLTNFQLSFIGIFST
ncbi:hypothetical protein EVAR_21339_1 [Eumeta japonica]|uniref:Uncharacterized protein n=1 Tax=Eumeta variegata TaxID=151549 RepID=A0A4C1ZMW8_EUMVA|nr:hypothetical protein EVAR_21339_1 [Eumeta japonica]